MYGIGSGRAPTTSAGSACWPGGSPRPACASSRSATAGWDQHSNLHARLTPPTAAPIDQPIAGLLDRPRSSAACSTTRWSSGAASSAARPHGPGHATAATTTTAASRCGWPAAASRAASPTAPPTSYGYEAVENKVHIHDLHATILHLLGLDHEQLTYRYAGRDFRLTDVHGNVVKDIMA